MILKSQYYTESSLKEDVDECSWTNRPITAAHLANIISKYIVSFALRTNPNSTLSYSEYREWTREVVETLQTREPLDWVIWEVKYQLMMVLDIPATIELMLDIIERIRELTYEGVSFRWLDIWSGSGILMLAQAIWARKSGKINIHITGIELDYRAQWLSDVLMQQLWVGVVIQWDSQDAALYSKVTPHFLSNENLSTRWRPFSSFDDRSKKTHFEPFLENLDVLIRVYWPELFTSAWFFPAWLQVWNILDGVPGRFYRAEDAYGLERIKMQSIRYNPADCTYPLQIPIWKIWKNLDEIGNSDELRVLFEHWWYREFRRWPYTSPEKLLSIYKNQRGDRRIR